MESMRALPLMLSMVCVSARTLSAQQLIGYVATKDADVAGAKDTVEGRAVLAGSVSVTAKDHTAPIDLARGGTVRVCQTSVLHVSESREMMVAAPLLFSLDRGAIEIETKTTPTDAVMTPDLRFTARTGGPLDLRLRVTTNGDTCVENRGAGAPILEVGDPFGDATYELTAGQHVMFEHGSLREVVDQEKEPCGCPPEALGATEFPLAQSEGLAPGSAATPTGMKISPSETTLSYTATVPAPTPAVAAPQTPVVVARKPGLLARMGRFFKRVFGAE